MNSILANYVCVTILLGLIYHVLPQKSIVIDNIYLFIGMGLVLYHLYNRIRECESNDNINEGFESSQPEPILTDREILNHVQTILSNIGNSEKLDQLVKVLKSDSSLKSKELLKIFNATVAHPVMIGRVVLTSPQQILDIVNAINENPEIKKTLLNAKANKLESTTVNRLEKKIASLEKIIASLDNTANIPDFLQKMMEKQKYIDRNGMVKDALYGDMKYHQGNPDDFQPVIKREDDEWDPTGYSIVNPKLWRPVDPTIRDIYQENKCPVCPSMTTGYPVNVMEFDESRYVIGSDNISLDYIKELNRKKI